MVMTGIAVSRFRTRVALLTFMGTFAFFLLAKPILMGYFDYAGLGWTSDTQTHLVTTLSVGLLAILFGYFSFPRVSQLGTRRSNSRTNKASISGDRGTRRSSIRRASLLVFFATLPFTIAFVASNVQTSNEFGYTALYTGSGGAFGTISAYGNVMNAVALFVLLATMPGRKLTFLVLMAATLPRAVALLSGDRGDFGTFLLTVFVYIVFRSRRPSTQLMKPRSMVITAVAGVAIVIPMFILVGVERGIGAGHSTLPDFLYGQGSSLNVLQYGLEYSALLPDTNYLLWFADQGFLRLIFDSEGGLGGNSVEYALSGTSFSHSLSYAVLGDLYLQGRGVGTSFLAEGYASLGYFGVILVGLMYGLILAWIDRFPLNGMITNALRLVIIPTVLFAPRGTATGFLAELMSPATVLVVALVWLLSVTLPSKDEGISEGQDAPTQQLTDETIDGVAMPNRTH